MLTVFKPNRQRKPDFRTKHPRFVPVPKETLTGFIGEKIAARDEEFFANALRKRGLAFWFRLNPTNIPSGLPGWVELDFLVEYSGLGKMVVGGLFKAIEIDDVTFVHRGQRKDADMVLKDIRRLEGLALRGIKLAEVIHITADRLQSAKEAEKVVRELFPN